MKRPSTLTLLGVIASGFVVWRLLGLHGDRRGKMSEVDWHALDLRKNGFPKEDLLKAAKDLEIDERDVKVKDFKIFYRKTRTISNALNILLLHGQSFKSETWLKLETIHFLAASGYNVIAVDLPGFGNSPKPDVSSDERGDVLESLILKLDIAPCVIVSPSYSGSFAIPLLKTRPELLKGFIPIAPTSTGLMTKEEYQAVKVPTLILRGNHDERLGVESVNNLKFIPTSRLFEIQNAGHACYMNEPDVFHEVVYNFLDVLSKA